MYGLESSPSVRLGQHDDEGDSIERPGCHLMQSLDAFSGLCAPQNSVLCDRTHQADYGESLSTTEMYVIAAQPFTYVYYHVKRRAPNQSRRSRNGHCHSARTCGAAKSMIPILCS